MNEKKKMIKIWSYILILTILVNILFFIFAVGSGDMWAIIIVYPLIAWDIVALVFWICSFNIKYKNLVIENSNIEIYAGFATHYIKVNGEIKDEYKASFTFTPIILSCSINKHKLQATISTSNHIVVKIDEELIR